MQKAMQESVMINTHLRCLARVINTCVVKALEEELPKYMNIYILGTSSQGMLTPKSTQKPPRYPDTHSPLAYDLDDD